MSESADDARRRYGAGSLSVRRYAGGGEAWYGHWRAGGRLVKRKLGLKRSAGSRDGLTRVQAEKRLRALMAETKVEPQARHELSVNEVATRYIANAQRQGRKPSTCANIESETRVHLEPFFRGRSLEAIRPIDVIELVSALERKGLAPKTIRNVVATLSALFNFARSPHRGWVTSNPCIGIELPAVSAPTEVRFLTLGQLDALVASARPGLFQTIDRAIFLTAAMTGLRKGELLALRWRDVDWQAGRIRVRRNYVRGAFGTPKSKRSTRSVPVANRVSAELRGLRSVARWSADDDLVFAHPASGGPLAKANVTRRMRAALRDAGIDEGHRFHDLRHTFGTQMAAAGVPMRTLQEWMGHRDLATTQRYADYAPSAHEAEMVTRAFSRADPGDGQP